MLEHSVVQALQSRWEAPPPARKRRKKVRTDQRRIVLRPAAAR